MIRITRTFLKTGKRIVVQTLYESVSGITDSTSMPVAVGSNAMTYRERPGDVSYEIGGEIHSDLAQVRKHAMCWDHTHG